MKILLLFDLSIPLKPEQYADYLKTEDWASEAHIMATLKDLGHEVAPLGIHDDLDPFLAAAKTNQPDLIFNLSEAFRGDRHYEPHIASLIELLDVPFTGASAHALNICKDKGLAKKILSYHRIKVPRFLISRKSSPLRSLADLQYPVFIKPLNLEASEGISQLSFAESKKDALERIRYLHDRFETDVIAEEYIAGRELYVGVIGNERLSTFPARELFFREVPEGEPKFASFKAKWDDDYRKKWGISTGPANLPDETKDRLDEVCKKIYRVLGLAGYGRIDLRLTESGELFCIEANPNPSIERDGDFALSALKSGLSYDDLIQKILNLAFSTEPGEAPRSGTRRKKK
jgi:D-alanine-D-alanine ligase